MDDSLDVWWLVHLSKHVSTVSSRPLVCNEACGLSFHLTVQRLSCHLPHTHYKSHTVTNKELTQPSVSLDTVNTSGLSVSDIKVHHGYSASPTQTNSNALWDFRIELDFA